MPQNLKYKRILLKISGESFGIGVSDLAQAKKIVEEIVEVYKQKVEIGLVVGGGNFIRGANLEKAGIARATGDYMGMMATVMNALLLQELLQKQGAYARVITARTMASIGEVYNQERCLRYLQEGQILIFAGGTGHPYFTTDTAAALKAVEIAAECLFKATKVDGVYDDDPMVNPQAHKFDFLPYSQVLSEKYRVMDLTAISFCMENKLPIRVFDLMTRGNLSRSLCGEKLGTLIAEANS